MPQDPILDQLKALGYNTSNTVRLESTSPIAQNLINNADITAHNTRLREQELAMKRQQQQQQKLSDGISNIVKIDNALTNNPDIVNQADTPSWYDLPGQIKSWASYWGWSDDLVNRSVAQSKLASSNATDTDIVISAALKTKIEQGDLAALGELKTKFQNIFDSPISDKDKESVRQNYQNVVQYVNNLNEINEATARLEQWYNNTDSATRQRQIASGILPKQIGFGPNLEKSLIDKLADLENNVVGSAVYNNADLAIFKNRSLEEIQSNRVLGNFLSSMELQYNAAMTAAVQNKLDTITEQISEQNKKIKEATDPVETDQLAKQLNTLNSQKNEIQALYDKVSPMSKESVYLKKYYPTVYEERQANKKQEMYRNSGEQSWLGRAGEAGVRTWDQFTSNLVRQISGVYSLVGADERAFDLARIADEFRPPSYFMGKDLNKNGQIDDEEITRDIHGNRITWDQLHYTTADGESNWNYWSATEQVLPIAADIGLTIALSKGVGGFGRSLGLTWSRLGGSLGLEAKNLATFEKAIAPRISTLGTVTATTFPRFYAEERSNFKNDGDAFGIALSRAVVEGFSETIIPDVLMFQKAGRGAGLLDDAFNKLGKKLPFDLNRFSAKTDILLGLTPKGSMSPLTAARILAPTALKNTLGQATQESIEELGSLLGNYFVDKYAQAKNFEVEAGNELSWDSIKETFVGGFIPSLFIGGVSGNIGLQKHRTGVARWDIANNPETYKAIIARQVENNKISKEEGIKKLAQIENVKNKFEQMMPEMANIKSLNTLLDDKEAQYNYFTNVTFLEDLLNVDVANLTDEQKAEYDKELAEAQKQVIKVRENADKYANLTEAEKQEIIKKNFESKKKALQNPENTLGGILSLAVSMNPEGLEKTAKDSRYEFMNAQYEDYMGSMTEALTDRVSTFEEILLNAPETLTLLELQVMREKFLPVLQHLEKQGSPFVGTLANAPLVETAQAESPQPMGPAPIDSNRLSQLIDAELANRVALTEEEAINQMAANLKNPEIRNEQNLNMAFATLTDEQLAKGELTKEEGEVIEKEFDAVTRFKITTLLELHKAAKDVNAQQVTPLETYRKAALNNNYFVATKDLDAPASLKKITEMNAKAKELSDSIEPRQTFGGRRGNNAVSQAEQAIKDAVEQQTTLMEYNEDVFDYFSGIVAEIAEVESNPDLDIDEKKQEKARLLKDAIVQLGGVENRIAFASGLIALFPQLGNKVDAIISEDTLNEDFFLGLFPTAPTLSKALHTSYKSMLASEPSVVAETPAQPPVQEQTQEEVNKLAEEEAQISEQEYQELVRLAQFFLDNPKEPAVVGSVVGKYPELFKKVTEKLKSQGETVNGIEKITFTDPQIELVPVVLDGNIWNVVNTSKRPKVLISINGVLVPFYLTTGLGGKGLKPGWYPFFGIGNDGWMNKTNKADMETYYARYWGPRVASVIQNISEQLNSAYGTDANAFADDADPTTTVRPLTTLASKVEDYINSVISITPFSNDETAKGMRGNVEELGRQITEALKPTSQTSDVTPEVIFSEKTVKEQKIEDAIIEDQVLEAASLIVPADSDIALKMISARQSNETTLTDPAVSFGYKILDYVSTTFRKGSNPNLTVRAQSMMGIYEFVLDPAQFAIVSEYSKKKKLNPLEAKTLADILTMDGRPLHNEGFMDYITKNPSAIGSGVGTVFLNADGSVARFDKQGKPTVNGGSYFISVLPKDTRSKRSTETTTQLRSTLIDNPTQFITSPVTGVLSGADVAQPISSRPDASLYLHTSEQNEERQTEFSSYTLLTGGLYLETGNPVLPYYKVQLPQAKGEDVLAMITAFNEGTLPPGLDPDLYDNPTAFLNYMENLIYFSEGKTGLRLGVNKQGKLAFYKKNKGGKYQQLTGSAATQIKTVNDALQKTFYSVSKEKLGTNAPFQFLKNTKDGLKVYNEYRTYEEYLRSPEFGAKFIAKENQTISFGSEITYSNVEATPNVVESIKENVPVEKPTQLDVFKDQPLTSAEDLAEREARELEQVQESEIERQRLAELQREYDAYKEAFTSESFGTSKERAIADHSPNFRITRKSFDRFGEPEFLKSQDAQGARLQYIAQVGGIEADVLAQTISTDTGVEVTTQDIVDFIEKYPGGVGSLKGKSRNTFYGTFNPDLRSEYDSVKKGVAFLRSATRISTEEKSPFDDDLFRSAELDNKITDEQNKKAEAWVNNHPIFKNTPFIFNETIRHPQAYAVWSKAGVFLYEGANYAEGYHEAWHEFSQMYLTPQEREALYEQAKKIYGNLSLVELEEKLAEDFRLYALSDGKTLPAAIKKNKEAKGIFQRMWDFIKAFFTNKKTVDTYFKDLYKGNLSSYRYQKDPIFKTLYSSKFVGKTEAGAELVLNHKDSAKLVEQMDSLFVHTANNMYAAHNISVVNILSNKKAIQAVYSNMARTINGLLDEYEKLPLDKLTSVRKQKYDYLQMLAVNYSNVVNHHITNSSLLESDKVKKSLLGSEVEFAGKETSEFAQFEAAINEKSGKANASPLIVAAIKTLPEYSENRRKKKDTVFGTDYLGNFDKNWDILQKTLADSASYEELYNRLETLSTKYLRFKPLLSYLPKPNEAVGRQSTLNFKNLFVNTFAQPYIDGFTSKVEYKTIEIEEKGKTEKIFVIEGLSVFESSNLDAVNLRRRLDAEFASTLGPYKLINPETGSYYLNAERYFKEFPIVPAPKTGATLEEQEQYNESLFKIIAPLGFNLSGAGLELLKKKDSSELYRAVNRIHNKMKAASEILPYITSPLTELSSEQKTTDKKAIPTENASVMSILSLETEANVEYVGDMRYNALGDKIWSVNPHTYMTRVVSALNNAESYPTLDDITAEFPQFDMELNPAVANSPILKYLFTADGRRKVNKDQTTRTIQIANLLGIEDKVNADTKTVDADLSRKHYADVMGLLQKGAEELNRLSGKSTTRSLVLPKDMMRTIYYVDQVFTNQNVSQVPHLFVREIIVPLIASEVLVAKNPSSRFKQDPYSNGVPKLGFFENILNESTRNSINEVASESSLVQIQQNILANQELMGQITQQFRDYIAKNVSQSKALLKDYPVDVDQLTKYHAISFANRVDQHKLFFGHPYFYKNAKDIEKRLSAWNAFGSLPVLDQQNLDLVDKTGYNQRNAYLDHNSKLQNPKAVIETEQNSTKISYLVLKDNPVISGTALTSTNYGKVQDDYVNNGKAQDAAAFSTMDFFKRFYSLSTGISEDMQKEFDRQDRIYSLYLQSLRGENVTPELTAALNEGPYYKFTIKKLQYAGQNIVDDTVVPVFHKYSVKPLLPSEIVNNSESAAILEKLHASGADYAVFESGTKISETVTPISLFDKGGVVNSNASAPGTIDMANLKEQVLIENKETFKTIFSSQFRKLLFKDMTPEAQDLYDAYVGYMNELVNYDKISFFQNIQDKEKLVEFLIRELSTKNASEATKDLIKLKENGELQYVLDSFLDRTIMESTMVSSIKSSILRQKLPGAQRVQYPVSLVRPNRKLGYYDLDGGKIRQAETIISFSKGYYPLLNLIYKNKPIGQFVDGKPVNLYSAVTRLNEALADPKFLSDNAELLDKALTTVAIRIPGQGYNSMESFRVVEFLPEESGEIILVPDEMVVKSGSDYDIDKLFCYDPYISKDGTVKETSLSAQELIDKKSKAMAELEDAYSVVRELLDDKAALIQDVKRIIDSNGFNSDDVELKDLYKRLVDLQTGLVDSEETQAGGLTQADLERLKNRDWSTKESKEAAAPIKNEIRALRSALTEARELNLTNRIGGVVDAIAEVYQYIDTLKEEVKSSRDLLANNIFLTIKERLSQPEIFDSLITPNSSDLIKEEAKKYQRTEAQTANYTNIVNPIYQLYVHSLNSFKKALGVDAKNNVFHSLAQKAGLKIIDEKAVNLYPLRANGLEDNVIDLSKVLDVDGNVISELNGQLITAHVDIEKEDDVALINLNTIITPTANYMAMAGSTFEDIIRLLNTKYVFGGKEYPSSITRVARGENLTAVLTEVTGKVDAFYKSQGKESPTKNASKDFRTDAMFEKTLYGDYLRLFGFLQAKQQQDEMFKVSRNTDFDTFSPENFESFYSWRKELADVYKSEYFNQEAISYLANNTEVSGFAIPGSLIQDVFGSLFPVSTDANIVGKITSLTNSKNRIGNPVALSKAFKNEYIYALYRNNVAEVAEFEKYLDKKNPANIFNLYSNLKSRLLKKGIESNNEIFDNAVFNTQDDVAFYRTGLSIVEADYTTDLLREEFEEGFNWTHPKLNPEKAEDAKLIDDMQAFFKAFAYAGIIGSNLNKRFDSYLPFIPEQVFTSRIAGLVKNHADHISLDAFAKRFAELHPEFFYRQGDANPDLAYFKDFDLSRESIVSPRKRVDLTKDSKKAAEAPQVEGPSIETLEEQRQALIQSAFQDLVKLNNSLRENC